MCHTSLLTVQLPLFEDIAPSVSASYSELSHTRDDSNHQVSKIGEIFEDNCLFGDELGFSIS